MRPSAATVVVVTLAFALHGYEQACGATRVSIGWLAWAMAPYVLSVAIGCLRGMRQAATFAAGAALLLDLWMHYAVFVAPTGSTAAVGLVFAPLVSLVILCPTGFAIGWWLTRHRVDLPTRG